MSFMDEYKILLKKARESMHKAYAPYSRFKVGAAVLTKSKKIYTGCNIENASYGATNCAERTAVFKAVSEGETEIMAIAVVSSSQTYTYPCGICRQVISEFMTDGDFIFENSQGEVKILPLKEIFPYSFTKEDLTKGGS